MNTSSSSPTGRRAVQWSLIFLFGIVSLALAIGGYGYHRQQAQAIHTERYNDLKAIAELKINQIVQWRQERLADTRLNSTGIVRTYFLQWLTAPDDDALRTALLERLRLYVEVGGYQNMILTDADGRLLLSLDPSLIALDPTAQQLTGQAVASRQVVFGDFFRCPVCNEVHLDVAAPILDENRRPVAVLIQRINPEQYLYPLIQSWPTPSQSAETLLLRRDGADALYLNTLRHVSDPPLTLRTPLTRADAPAVQAVLGRTGEFQGRDYRDVEVLAEIQPVPDSPWFMIAKVDTSELLAEAHFRGRVILLLVVLAILMTGILAAFVNTNRRRHLTQALLRADQGRWQAQEETRATLYSIGDGVIATDAAGCVTRMNPVAERLTGRREVEALGKPLAQVFHIINEDTRAEVENPVQRVLREGVVVGLANHSLLIARDGTERPIADSGAPIRDEQGKITGVVLVFRDQTEERAAQRALRESEMRFRSLYENTSIGLYRTTVDGRILMANPALIWMLGYESFAQLAQRNLAEEGFAHDYPRREFQERIVRDGEIRGLESAWMRRDGSTIFVRESARLVRDESDKPIYYEGTAEDITERKRVEREILQRNEELAMLNQIGQALSRLAEPSEILELMYTVVGHVLDNRNLYIALYDEANQQTAFPVYTIDGERRTPPSRPFGNGLTEYVIRTRAPLLLPDRMAGRMTELGIASIGAPARCFLAVPMLAGEKVIGVIAVQDYEQGNVYNEAHLELLSTIAAQAAIALENARLYAVAQQELAERKRAETQLNEQLDELRRWHAATLGREARILDLKREVNELLAQIGKPPRYPSAEAGNP